MLTTIRKMSLRTRLALLAGFAVVSLLVALFVAWRLARTTETFALRQADSAVNSAARELARELQRNPEGYTSIEQTAPTTAGRRKPSPVAPHVQRLFATYSDPFARLTAITLHPYPNVEGGFYRPTDGRLIGYSLANEPGANLPSQLRELASVTATTGVPASHTEQLGNYRFILAAYPTDDDEIATAWAMQRVQSPSGVSDWPNLVAVVTLGLSIILVSGLALVTVKDLRSGVAGIEAGLAGLPNDLSKQVPSAETPELARIANAINELAATLEANIVRQAQLERKLRQGERLSALGRVVAGVAHEVRNPLAAIKLKVQLAQRSPYDAAKLDQTFGVIRDEVERLDTLVRKLLELGDQQKLERKAVNLAEITRGRITLFNDLAVRAGVAIQTRELPASLVIEGAGDRLAQVVDNLIQNALDAMPGGGTLTINGAEVNDQDGAVSVRLTFEDTGHGIANADQENIFEPFHTGRATGTGLGLAIARAIVEEHDGHIGFVSKVGMGTSFMIVFPSAPSTAAKSLN